MNSLSQKLARQRGFTLVELLVSLILGLLVMGGITQIFLGNRENYRLQAGMATLQENARFAIETLRRDFGMAGLGLTGNPFNPAGTTDGPTTDAVEPILGANVDCLGTVLPGAPVVLAWSRHAYAIGDPDGNGTTGLTCSPNGAAPQTLVEGIDNMQLLYGLDTTSDQRPDLYVGANSVGAANWGNVVAVRVALLVNTINPVTRNDLDANTYMLLSAQVPAFNDRLRRRVYTSTMLVRNSAPEQFW